MKKNIAILLGLGLIILVFSSCATHTKCAAYGHYSYHEVKAPIENETL